MTEQVTVKHDRQVRVSPVNINTPAREELRVITISNTGQLW